MKAAILGAKGTAKIPHASFFLHNAQNKYNNLHATFSENSPNCILQHSFHRSCWHIYARYDKDFMLKFSVTCADECPTPPSSCYTGLAIGYQLKQWCIGSAYPHSSELEKQGSAAVYHELLGKGFMSHGQNFLCMTTVQSEGWWPAIDATEAMTWRLVTLVTCYWCYWSYCLA